MHGLTKEELRALGGIDSELAILANIVNQTGAPIGGSNVALGGTRIGGTRIGTQAKA